MNIINIIDKGSQTEKNAYCMIPFIDFKKIKTSDETNLVALEVKIMVNPEVGKWVVSEREQKGTILVIFCS